jgi:hypothetical protein
MNETFTITLLKDGKPWPIDALRPAPPGIVLNNEVNARPRSMSIELLPRAYVTEVKLHDALQQRIVTGLPLTLVREGTGTLTVRGADEGALPSGFYWFRLEVEDLKTGGRQSLDLKENVSVPVLLNVTEDKRTIQVRQTIDPQIREFLDSATWLLDGMSPLAWLASPLPRARRKACFLNMLAKLRSSPSPDSPLLPHIDRVFFCDVDKIYTTVDTRLLGRLRDLADDQTAPFRRDQGPLHPDHQNLVRHVGEAGLEADTTGYTLESYREVGLPSMHIVVANPPVPDRRCYAEVDVDLANPFVDVRGLAIHAWELLTPAKTNHLDLWKKLGRGVTGAYLPYTVIRM